MKVESRSIRKNELSDFINLEYGIEIDSLSFNPHGEDSYSYIVESKQGKYFIKLYTKIVRKSDAKRLNGNFQILSFVKESYDAEFVIIPIEIKGQFLIRFQNFFVSVLTTSGHMRISPSFLERGKDKIFVGLFFLRYSLFIFFDCILLINATDKE